MKVLRRLMMFACVSVLLASCGDDGGLSLTLTSPSDGTVYTAGDVITITGTATDDIAVVNISIEVPELTVQSNIAGNGTPTVPFTGEILLVDGTPAVEDVTIRVTATDDEGNTAVEERSVSVQ